MTLSWPEGFAAAAAFTFDVDAESCVLAHDPRASERMSLMSHQSYGPRVGVPRLLRVLARQEVRATFFVIDKHITDETLPIVRRTFEEGHAVAVHWHSRDLMFKSPASVASTIQRVSARLEHETGHQACRAFRPHAGQRSIPMIMGAARIGYRVVGFGWMAFDFNWFKARNADDLVRRFTRLASPGTIIVIHDGHHKNPRADRRYAVETVDRLIPELRARGFEFGTICE